MARVSRYSEFSSGWTSLFAATVGSAVGVTALLFYSLGSFTAVLQREFGWSRAEVSSSFLFVAIALTVAAAPLGWLLDRFGPRKVVLASAPGLALSLVLLSQYSGGLGGFYFLFALAGLLGAGTTSVVYTKAVNSSFVKARGLALGISLAGLGAAALVLPPLVTGVIQPLGWRAGFLVLAALSLLAVPFAFRLGSNTGPTGKSGLSQSGATRREALSSRIFWTLLVGFLLVGGSLPAIIPHMVPMLTDAGMGPAAAARIASVIGVGVIVGRLCIGFLVDRVFAPFVAAPLFAVTALGCLLLVWGGTGAAPFAALMIGVSFGAEADLIALFCGNYFGLRSYGFLYGLIYSLFSLAVSIGPIWVGLIYDRTQSYKEALFIVAAMLLSGALILLSLPRWHRSIGHPYSRTFTSLEKSV